MTIHRTMLPAIAAIVLTYSAHVTQASEPNWPQFRGPDGLGIAPDNHTYPTILNMSSSLFWITGTPRGYSSPRIWGDTIFITGKINTAEETTKHAPVALKHGITMTFSLAAADPEAGVCGAAVASGSQDVGKIVAYARGGVGAFCTQWAHEPPWGKQALDLLADSQPPEAVLADLLRADEPEAREFRQLGIVDMQGRTAVHNPTKVPAGIYWGAMMGKYYTCQGGLLAGRQVIVDAAQAYEETQGSLADRLMAALLAGNCAGGDLRGQNSAGLRVAKAGVEGYWLELYVTDSDDAVIELARKYCELEHDAKGDWPGGKLPFEHPCPNQRKTNVAVPSK